MKKNIVFGILSLVSIPAVADTYDQYAPYINNAIGIFSHGIWTAKNTSTTKADISWGEPNTVEEHEIKHNCDGNNSYIWLNAYRDDALGYRFRVETTQAFYTDLATGDTFDITAGGSCGTDGQPYALYNVGWPYKIKV